MIASVVYGGVQLVPLMPLEIRLPTLEGIEYGQNIVDTHYLNAFYTEAIIGWPLLIYPIFRLKGEEEVLRKMLSRAMAIRALR